MLNDRNLLPGPALRLQNRIPRVPTLLLALLAAWMPSLPSAAQSPCQDPSKLGINTGIPYPRFGDDAPVHDQALDRTEELGMRWTLSIEREGNNGLRVAQTLQDALSRCMNPLIRTCIGNGCPFVCSDDNVACSPTAAELAQHLQGILEIAATTDVSGCDPQPKVHVLTGPNEPNREFWLPDLAGLPGEVADDGTLTDEQIQQVALANAEYMRDVAQALSDPDTGLSPEARSRTVLLSPAFDCVNTANVPRLIAAMIAEDDPFQYVDGMAFNTYNDGSSQSISDFLATCRGYFQGSSAPLDYIVVTETGMIEIRIAPPEDPTAPCTDTDERPADCVDNNARPAALTHLREQMEILCNDSSVQGALFFNSLGTNDDRSFNYNLIDDLTVGENEPPRVNTAEWDYLLGGTGVGAPAQKCCDLAEDNFCDLLEPTDECPMTLAGGYCDGASGFELGAAEYQKHCTSSGAFYDPFDSAFDFALRWRPLSISSAVAAVVDSLGSKTAFIDRALRVSFTGDTGASQSYVSDFIAAEDGSTLEISAGMKTSNADKPTLFVDLFDSELRLLKTAKTLRGFAGSRDWQQFSARARLAAGGRNTVSFARVRIQAGDVYRLGSGDTATTWFDNVNLNLNHLPEAEIAVVAPRTIFPGDRVFLDGGGSSDPEGQPLSFSWGVIENQGLDVTLENPIAQETSFIVPATKEDRQIVVALKVSDGELKSPTEKETIDVTGANSAPTIIDTNEVADVAVTGHTYDTTIRALDPDADLLSFSVQGPAGMTIGPESGEILWEVDNGDLGSHLVTVAVSDGEDSDSFGYTLRVFQGEDFGDVPIGTAVRSTSRVFNGGGGILIISSVTLVSGDLDQFRIVGDGCTGAQLPGGDPNAFCDIEWEFLPTSEGFKSALFQLSGNAPTFTGALVGDGVLASATGSSLSAPQCSRMHVLELGSP